MSSAPDLDLAVVATRLGRRIAELRAARGFTLEQLATVIGLTKGYISKIENGKAVPPIGTLIKFAQGLRTDISDLIDEDSSAERNDDVCVVRSWQQEVNRGTGAFGYDYIALAQKKHHKRMEPFVMILEEEYVEDVDFEHSGEEFMYVLSGEIEWEMTLDGRRKTWVLSKGDSMYFNSRLPHRGRSLKGQSSVLLVIYRGDASIDTDQS